MEGTADSMVRVIRHNSSNDRRLCTSQVYHRSTAVTRDAFSALPHSTLQPPSSSPATHVSLGRIENFTTPGWSGHGPPTSSPVSPPIHTSPSVSSLIHRHKTLRRSPDFEQSPDPLQIISPSRQRDEDHNHDPFPVDYEMLDPSSSPNSEGRDHGAMLLSLAGSSSPPINPMQRSLSADPFVVPAPAPTEANQDEGYPNSDANAVGGRYSMRSRQPRQLKPYAIDRLEYKHQLKHHPDAIVRFAGLRNPVESSPSPAPSNAGESGSDGAAGNSASERSSNHLPVSTHTKAKKRRRTGAERHLAMPPATHRETSRTQPATNALARIERRMSGSPIAEVFPRAPSLPDQEGSDGADAPLPWYPDAFNDLSSGLGSEDEPLSVVQQAPPVSHPPPPRAKRRRVIAWFQRCVRRANEWFLSALRAIFQTCRHLLPRAPLYRILPHHMEVVPRRKPYRQTVALGKAHRDPSQRGAQAT